MYEPDWKGFYTPEEAEAQLEDFKFKGPGWYETKTDTMLVLDPPRPHGPYEFWCWNSPNARHQWADAVSKITHMPVRVKAYSNSSG